MPQDYRPATYSRGIKIGKPTYVKTYGEKRTPWKTGTWKNPWQHDEYAKMPQIPEEERERRWKVFQENTSKDNFAKSVERRGGKAIYKY